MFGIESMRGGIVCVIFAMPMLAMCGAVMIVTIIMAMIVIVVRMIVIAMVIMGVIFVIRFRFRGGMFVGHRIYSI